MPLTNAEKQKAHRQRQREKIARYKGALKEIAGMASEERADYASYVASNALR